LVGDVIKLSSGNLIFADGLVVNSNELSINEQAINGLTNPVLKNSVNYCKKKI